MTSLIFVYGTLKQGFCRNHYLKTAHYHGTACTLPDYRLYDLGSYPGMIQVDRDGLAIEGELYEVDRDLLRVLDEVEGVAEGLYVRCRVRIQQPIEREVQTYLYNCNFDKSPDCGKSWEAPSTE